MIIENSKTRLRAKDSLSRNSSEENRSIALLQEPLISDGLGLSNLNTKKDRTASFMIQDQSSSNQVNHLQLNKLAVEKNYNSHGGGDHMGSSDHQISGGPMTSKGGYLNSSGRMMFDQKEPYVEINFKHGMSMQSGGLHEGSDEFISAMNAM